MWSAGQSLALYVWVFNYFYNEYTTGIGNCNMNFYNIATQMACCKCGFPMTAIDSDLMAGTINWVCSHQHCIIYGMVFQQKLSVVTLTPMNMQ